MWQGLLWEGDVVSLYYMRGRWYDPAVGRFIQEDPLHAGVNDYTFANDDPVNGSDPSGLCDATGVLEAALLALANGDSFSWRCADLTPSVTTAQRPGPTGPPSGPAYGSSFPSGPEGGTGAYGGTGATSTGPQPTPKSKKTNQACRLTLSPLAVRAGQEAFARTMAAYSEQGNVLKAGRIIPLGAASTDASSAMLAVPVRLLPIDLLAHGHIRYGPTDHVYGHASSYDVAAAQQLHAPVLAYSIDSESVAFPNGRVFTCWHP